MEDLLAIVGVFSRRLNGWCRYETQPRTDRADVGGRGYGALMKVARRLPVLGQLNAGKAATLWVTGAELDRVRAGVWARFSGAKTAHLSKRQIRDRLMADGAPAKFNVPQRLWRATVEDTVDKIRAWQQAVVVTEVRPKIYARTGDDNHERKRLLGLAKSARWREDAWLSRQCRRRLPQSGPLRAVLSGLWPTIAPMTCSVMRRVGCGWRL